ncbi:hypothetical protein Trydic_g12832 [Trypoxylus dichotomus]
MLEIKRLRAVWGRLGEVRCGCAGGRLYRVPLIYGGMQSGGAISELEREEKDGIRSVAKRPQGSQTILVSCAEQARAHENSCANGVQCSKKFADIINAFGEYFSSVCIESQSNHLHTLNNASNATTTLSSIAQKDVDLALVYVIL